MISLDSIEFYYLLQNIFYYYVYVRYVIILQEHSAQACFLCYQGYFGFYSDQVFYGMQKEDYIQLIWENIWDNINQRNFEYGPLFHLSAQCTFTNCR